MAGSKRTPRLVAGDGDWPDYWELGSNPSGRETAKPSSWRFPGTRTGRRLYDRVDSRDPCAFFPLDPGTFSTRRFLGSLQSKQSQVSSSRSRMRWHSSHPESCPLVLLQQLE